MPPFFKISKHKLCWISNMRVQESKTNNNGLVHNQLSPNDDDYYNDNNEEHKNEVQSAVKEQN